MSRAAGLPVAVAVLTVVWFVPFGGLDLITRRTLALMFFTIVLWITRPWAPALTGMLFMILAWLLIGVLFPLCLSGTFIYQHAFGLIAYDYGTFEEPDYLLGSLVRHLALVAAILVGYYVWWPLLGLL